MRILFVGSVDFSRHALGAVLQNHGNVVGILNPTSTNATQNHDYTDLEPIAKAKNIPLFRVRQINDPETVRFVRHIRPDIVFVFGFSQLIKSELLGLAPLGIIGSHPTLLPEGRGRHPLIWALVKGLDRSGLTFFYIDEGADSGDILWQRPFTLSKSDDATTLYEKIKVLASQGISEFMPLLKTGKAIRQPQDHNAASHWPKRYKKDGEIDWSNSAEKIYNLIRALTHPYPGAHTYYGQNELIVWRSRIIDNGPTASHSLPGEILRTKGRELIVKTGDGNIGLMDWTCNLDIIPAAGCSFERPNL